MTVEKNIMRQKSFKSRSPKEKEYDERVVEIARVSRVVKGGRRIRFRALAVIGNHNGKVGMGIATANEVSEAVKKAVSRAKKKIINVPVIDGTIPYPINVKYGASKIIFKPASKGTSIVAGGAVRTVVELAGISDILTKIIGTRNKINNVYATIKALDSFDERMINKIKSFKNEKPSLGSDDKTAKNKKKIISNKKDK